MRSPGVTREQKPSEALQCPYISYLASVTTPLSINQISFKAVNGEEGSRLAQVESAWFVMT